MPGSVRVSCRILVERIWALVSDEGKMHFFPYPSKSSRILLLHSWQNSSSILLPHMYPFSSFSTFCWASRPHTCPHGLEPLNLPAGDSLGI